MTNSVMAFAPANMSCVFSICKSKNPRWTGSCGIGFTLSEGVCVKALKSTRTDVFFNEKRVQMPTVNYVLENLSQEKVEIHIKCNLTLGCGFGLSGASALASAYAVNKLLRLGKTQ